MAHGHAVTRDMAKRHVFSASELLDECGGFFCRFRHENEGKFEIQEILASVGSRGVRVKHEKPTILLDNGKPAYRQDDEQSLVL